MHCTDALFLKYAVRKLYCRNSQLFYILSISATPEQPQNVTAVEVTTTSLLLQWVEPHDNNAPILGYRITYNRPSFLGGTEVILNNTVEMINITGLHPGASYTFVVIAFNDIGDSSQGSLVVSTAETGNV